MTKIQKLTLGIIFTFFSINMSGCSDSETTVSSSPPTIQVSLPSDFDFGTVTEGNIASPQEIIITNLGSERLDMSSISLSDTTDFKLDTMNATNPCLTASPALATGESCAVEVSFTPTKFNPSQTAFATILTINSNDPNTPSKNINLYGASELVSSQFTVKINQVDTANCPTVTAYVSVTDQEGFPVDDLNETDFSITEGITVIGPPTGSTVGDAINPEPISIALVLDNSSSMSDADVIEMNKAAIDVINQLNTPDDQAEIIKFDKGILLKEEFTNITNDLIDAVNTPVNGSGTALYDTLLVAINDFNLISGRKAIIVITDGANSTATTATVSDITDGAQAQGIPIFVIALGNIDPDDITNVMGPIANDTSGELYQAEAAQNFGTIIKEKLTEVLFTDQYILDYTSGILGGPDVNLTVGASNTEGSGTNSKLVPPCL